MALSFSPGDTVEIGRLFLRGLKETEGVFSNLITLSSTTPGSPWLLDVEGGDYIVSGVNVSDCNALAGVKIVAGALTSDPSGSCVNWDFAALHAAEWTGLGGDNAFSTGENLHPCAPSSATRAIVSPTSGSATANVSSPLDLGALGVCVGGGSATISFNNGLSTNVVAGDVYHLSGTLTHQATSDSSNAATHALFLSAGGDINIAQSIAVNPTAKGHHTRTGPDAIPNQGTSKYNGASHGGVGGGEGPYKGAMCYGSIKYPRTAGSGGNVGNEKGGGIVGLVAGGTVRHYGTISANTAYDYNSGGSVCIVADAILGSGSISANGGNIVWSTRLVIGNQIDSGVVS